MNKNKKYLFYSEKRKLAHPFDLSNIKSVEILNKKDFHKEKYIEEIERRWDIDGGNLQEVEVLFFDKYEVISKVKEDLLNRAFDNICDRYARRDGNYYLDNVQFNEQQFIFIECCKILESLFQ